MVHLCLDEALCKHPKVIGGLNIIGNIPGIFLKNPGKIMEFCQSRNVGTLVNVCKFFTELSTSMMQRNSRYGTVLIVTEFVSVRPTVFSLRGARNLNQGYFLDRDMGG